MLFSRTNFHVFISLFSPFHDIHPHFISAILGPKWLQV